MYANADRANPPVLLGVRTEVAAFFALVRKIPHGCSWRRFAS